MSKVIFNSGVITLNPKDEENKKSVVFLAFHPANQDHKKYDALEKSLPVIDGLKRRSHRAEFAFDIIQNLNELGYDITEKQKVANRKEL